jgi:hypothetical protein
MKAMVDDAHCGMRSRGFVIARAKREVAFASCA